MPLHLADRQGRSWLIQVVSKDRLSVTVRSNAYHQSVDGSKEQRLSSSSRISETTLLRLHGAFYQRQL